MIRVTAILLPTVDLTVQRGSCLDGRMQIRTLHCYSAAQTTLIAWINAPQKQDLLNQMRPQKRRTAEMQKREIFIYTTLQSSDYINSSERYYAKLWEPHVEYFSGYKSQTDDKQLSCDFPLIGVFLGNSIDILQSYNPIFLLYHLFICFICSPSRAKSVTPRFVQCHGNQTPMCMKMRLLWSVCLEFVGPMDPFLIRVCVCVWASLFA